MQSVDLRTCARAKKKGKKEKRKNDRSLYVSDLNKHIVLLRVINLT